jgi:hypothetical protein
MIGSEAAQVMNVAQLSPSVLQAQFANLQIADVHI